MIHLILYIEKTKFQYKALFNQNFSLFSEIAQD